ncbi:MAG: hypothetical protein BWY95_01383 [Bacteroidetes bacterium ADurb.BinA104]|nr:MAG: hypothetical protein BWY95_01383 [Bacteroidetes bacterium ADurb.BinA104]
MSDLNFSDHRFHTAGLLHLKSQVCGGTLVLEEVDSLQVEIPFRPGGSGLGNSFHRDLLHQFLVVGLHGIQTVDQVIEAILLVGGRITQREQRVESFQVLFGLLSFNRLRLVDDQDWIGFGNHIYRSAAAEAIQFHVDAPGILPPGIERLSIDDHHVKRVVAGKTVDFCQL